jgi:hypothetical protein
VPTLCILGSCLRDRDGNHRRFLERLDPNTFSSHRLLERLGLQLHSAHAFCAFTPVSSGVDLSGLSLVHFEADDLLTAWCVGSCWAALRYKGNVGPTSVRFSCQCRLRCCPRQTIANLRARMRGMSMDEMDYFSSKTCRASIDEDAELDEYFATYVPLSNLPTPPTSPVPILGTPGPISEFTCEMQTDTAQGRESILMRSADPSQRLSRLVPQNASRQRPCPALIASYLNRARLPESTVAFAACILDSLSRQFVRAWRRECDAVNTSRRSAFQSTSCPSELIVLAALAIANGFLDDVRGEPRWWASYVACGAVQLKEVDATIRCVFKDLDYDLCGFTADEVDEMREECFGQRATVHPSGVKGFF